MWNQHLGYFRLGFWLLLSIAGLPVFAQGSGGEVPSIEKICGFKLHDAEEGATVLPPCDIEVKCQSSESGAKCFLALMPDSSNRCYSFVPTSCNQQDATCVFSSFRFRILGDEMFTGATLFAYSVVGANPDPTTFGTDCHILSEKRSLPRWVRLSREVLSDIKVSLKLGKRKLIQRSTDGNKDDVINKQDEPLTIELDPTQSSDLPRVLDPLRVLTRPAGSLSWFVQNPPVLTHEEPRRWLQTKLLYLVPAGFAVQTDDLKNFELMVVQTGSSLPSGWIGEDELSLKLHRKSAIFPMRFSAAPPQPELAITRVGTRKIRAGDNNQVQDRGIVELGIDNKGFHNYQIYVGKRYVNAPDWKIFRAIPNGNTGIWITVEEISFSEPPKKVGNAEPERHAVDHQQLIGIASIDDLPETVMTPDLFSKTLGVSEIVTFTLSHEFGAAMPSSFPSKLSLLFYLLLITLLAIFGLPFLIWVLMRFRKMCSEAEVESMRRITENGANFLQKGILVIQESINENERNPGCLFDLCMGLAICYAIWYGLTQQFLEFYPYVVKKVLGQSMTFSTHWAIWVVLLIILAGIFLHLNQDTSNCLTSTIKLPVSDGRNKGVHPWWIKRGIPLSLSFLLIMQGVIFALFLYPDHDNQVSQVSGFRLAHLVSKNSVFMPFLAGLCFTLIDICSAYFAFHLIRKPATWLFKEASLLVFKVPYLLLRFLQYVLR